MTGEELGLDTKVDDFEGTVIDAELYLRFTEREPQIVVVIDQETLRDHDLIPLRQAGKFCNHDEDDAYDRGLQKGRLEFGLGQARELERWHNGHHDGPYRFCYEEPCKAVRNAEADVE